MNKCFDVSMQIQESMSMSIAGCQLKWLSILAHLAHLTHSYFSVVFSAIIHTIALDSIQRIKRFPVTKDKLGEKWPMLTTFLSRRQPPLLVTLGYSYISLGFYHKHVFRSAYWALAILTAQARHSSIIYHNSRARFNLTINIDASSP